MTKKLLSVCGLSLLLLAGAARAGAQTVAAGPYYAVPSWDQTIVCTALANCPRFIVLSNMNSAAVLDRETGLVWQRTPRAGYISYEGAAQLCPQESTGGRFGWRLPSLHELTSLLVLKTIPAFTDGLFLPDGHPFIEVTPDQFWTNTKRPYNNQQLFYTAGVGRRSSPFDSVQPPINSAAPFDAPVVRMWCVRGGGVMSLH